MFRVCVCGLLDWDVFLLKFTDSNPVLRRVFLFCGSVFFSFFFLSEFYVNEICWEWSFNQGIGILMESQWSLCCFIQLVVVDWDAVGHLFVVATDEEKICWGRRNAACESRLISRGRNAQPKHPWFNSTMLISRTSDAYANVLNVCTTHFAE